MTGLVVTWEGDDIHVIDEDNFESTVIEVVEQFFDAVDSYQSVTVEWKAGAWDYGSEYKITDPPTKQLVEEKYVIRFEGQSRHGEYEIDMSSAGLFVEKLSTGQKKQLDYLTLRAPNIAVDRENEEVFVDSIPERIRTRVVQSLPTIEI